MLDAAYIEGVVDLSSGTDAVGSKVRQCVSSRDTLSSGVIGGRAETKLWELLLSMTK